MRDLASLRIPCDKPGCKNWSTRFFEVWYVHQTGSGIMYVSSCFLHVPNWYRSDVKEISVGNLVVSQVMEA